MSEPANFLSDETVHHSKAGSGADKGGLRHVSGGMAEAVVSPSSFVRFPHVANISAASTGNDHV